jgi:hypothetical protein
MNDYLFKDGFAPPEDGGEGNGEEHQHNEAENGNNDEEF